MGAVETSSAKRSCLRFLLLFCKQLLNLKMSEAQDAFIIFDEAYEGVDVDAFYLGDILRALGCNVTNAKVAELGALTPWALLASPSPTSEAFMTRSKPISPRPESRRTTSRARRSSTRRVPARSPSQKSRTFSSLSARSWNLRKLRSSALF